MGGTGNNSDVIKEVLKERLFEYFFIYTKNRAQYTLLLQVTCTGDNTGAEKPIIEVFRQNNSCLINILIK